MFTSHYQPQEGCETIFTVDPRPVKFGPGAIAEIGFDARALGMHRVAVFTDTQIAELELFEVALKALANAGIETQVYSQTLIEPTNESFSQATDFIRADKFDGFISIGGGSVIDTAKAANLFASHPMELLHFVNKPIGEGQPVPGPLLPHIACPTTAGTGSESTGVAIFDLLTHKVKTGISSRFLKPSLGIIDPRFAYSQPPLVGAATGFDVLTHAIESYTAAPYTHRKQAADPSLRPPYQGANPHSDSGSLEAIRLGGEYLIRSVTEPDDTQARNAMSYAATLAGISFGNSGVHIPHAMSYSVAGLIRDYQPPGWPGGHSLCPHGISVVVNAPAAFRFTGPSNPQRHLQVAALLGAQTGEVSEADAGDCLAQHLIDMMKITGIPNGLGELNYSEADIPELTEGAYTQQRLLATSPLSVSREDLSGLYSNAMRYW